MMSWSQQREKCLLDFLLYLWCKAMFEWWMRINFQSVFFTKLILCEYKIWYIVYFNLSEDLQNDISIYNIYILKIIGQQLIIRYKSCSWTVKINKARSSASSSWFSLILPMTIALILIKCLFRKINITRLSLCSYCNVSCTKGQASNNEKT